MIQVSCFVTYHTPNCTIPECNKTWVLIKRAGEKAQQLVNKNEINFKPSPTNAIALPQLVGDRDFSKPTFRWWSWPPWWVTSRYESDTPFRRPRRKIDHDRLSYQNNVTAAIKFSIRIYYYSISMNAILFSNVYSNKTFSYINEMSIQTYSKFQFKSLHGLPLNNRSFMNT